MLSSFCAISSSKGCNIFPSPLLECKRLTRQSIRRSLMIHPLVSLRSGYPLPNYPPLLLTKRSPFKQAQTVLGRGTCHEVFSAAMLLSRSHQSASCSRPSEWQNLSPKAGSFSFLAGSLTRLLCNQGAQRVFQDVSLTRAPSPLSRPPPPPPPISLLANRNFFFLFPAPRPARPGPCSYLCVGFFFFGCGYPFQSMPSARVSAFPPDFGRAIDS